jgi:hypothetical protein
MAHWTNIAGATAMLRPRRGWALGALALLAPLAATPSHAAEFIPQIITSSTVPANGDGNPYGVAVVPANFPTGGSIKPGDVLVSNFNDKAGLQGTGTTIVAFDPSGFDIAPNGSAKVFFQGAKGLGLTTALGTLSGGDGFVVVGNAPTTDGTFKTLKSGSLLFIGRDGSLVHEYKNVDGPWDLTIVDRGSTATIFLSNVKAGTVTRLAVAVGAKNVTVTGNTTIATGYKVAPNAAALVLGPTGLAYDAASHDLYVASTGDNAIYQIANANTATAAVTKGTLVAQGGKLRGPLGLVLASNGDLLAANGDAVNADVKQPSEIVEFTKAGKFVDQFNVDAAQGGAFGIAVGPVIDSGGKADKTSVNFAAVDDVPNTVSVYRRDLP